ncbi:MAG: serine hydrolase domain-containing protein [Pseudomonadota bacterium]|nr:serine hydrolase domain-containing protein [Pseudomonadota bacterium]
MNKILGRIFESYTFLFLSSAGLIMSPSVVLAQDFSEKAKQEISGILDLSQKEFNIPGFVALVTNSEREIYAEAFGFSDVANKSPMQVDNIFAIASMTKPITSTAAMILIEGGKVSLEDPISSHIENLPPFEIFDEFDFVNGTYTTQRALNEVTIKQLLTHTSGMAYNFNSKELAAAGLPLTGAISADRFLLQHEPGEKWTYGPSTNLIGDLVEEISGKGLLEFMEDEIFTPLGMTETFYTVPHNSMERVVTTHIKIGDNFMERPKPEQIIQPVEGHGGLSSTARDYAKFMRLYLRSGAIDSGKNLISPETIELMTTNNMGSLKAELQPEAMPNLAKAFPQGAGIDTWGLGFQISESQGKDRRAPGSLSWAGLFNTKFWIDRENNIAALLLMQYLPFEDESHLEVLDRFEEAIYSRLLSD